MPNAAALAASLTYTPPGGSAITSLALNISPNYRLMNAATLDIPGTTGSATLFTVPFGGITKPKTIIIKNLNEQEMGIRFNADGANHFSLPPGGEIIIACPTEQTATPITGMKVVTTALQSAVPGYVETFVFGDD